MASYGVDERFRTRQDCFRLNDPGAYTIPLKKVKNYKHGFLSSAPRNTQCWRAPYTENIYNGNISSTIPTTPNVTSLKSKTPRFSYPPLLTEEELEEILCRCGIENTCECPLGEEKECQANVRKRLFKGPPPHCSLGVGLSIPTKRDRGFEILNDGSTRRLLDVVVEESPPFYDARVYHSPEFYRGCKWSNWTAPRTLKSLEVRPGPADYCIEREKTQNEICAEKVRANRRKKSNRLSFIELVQKRNILEGRPGPSDYNPQPPKGTDLQFLGPKAPRFILQKLEKRPSPASYSVKRDFDLPEPPEKPCHALLPSPACFGVKAQRFKERIKDCPGPGAYDAGVKLCKVLNCSNAPFGCSALRFKEKEPDSIKESDEDEFLKKEEDTETKKCPTLTSQFKSRTKRFRCAKIVFDPVLPYITKAKVERSVHLQEIAPFHSSQERFLKWFDWSPIHVPGVKTPGPGYYNLTKPKCLPAFKAGPLYRDRRFRENTLFNIPAPNEYTVGRGIETVLQTYNKKLKINTMQRSERFKWIPPPEPRLLSSAERELIILTKAIRQLEVEDEAPAPEKPDLALNVHKDIEDRISADKAEKHPSADKEAKRASTEIGEKRASADEGEKRASADEGEKRASADKGEKRASAEKGEKRAGADKGEKRASADNGEKRAGADKEEKHISANKTEEGANADKEARPSDIKAPKQKLLRTFLYKHPTPVYF